VNRDLIGYCDTGPWQNLLLVVQLLMMILKIIGVANGKILTEITHKNIIFEQRRRKSIGGAYQGLGGAKPP